MNTPPARVRPCGECPGCAGGVCDAYRLRVRWRRWRESDPRVFGFNVRYLWVRVSKRHPAHIVRVRWNPNGGRLEPLPFEPPGLRELVEKGLGWWSDVEEPGE